MSITKVIAESIALWVLYLIVPEQYDKVAVSLFIVLYFFQVYRILRYSKEEHSIVSFNLFFLIMFTLCSYLIPIFYVLNSLDNISFFFHNGFNVHYIRKAVFLCSIAIEFYSFGYTKAVKAETEDTNAGKLFRNIKGVLHVCKFLAIATTLFLIYSFSQAKAAGLMDVTGYVGTITNCGIIVPLCLAGYFNKFEKLSLGAFCKKNIIILSCAIIGSVCMLSIGDRLIAINLLTALLVIIHECVYKFKVYQVLVALCLGVVFMFLISYTRGSDMTISEGAKAYSSSVDDRFVLFQDVIPANNLLLFSAEISENTELYKPLRIIPIAFAPIPFIPSLIKMHFFNGSISTSYYLTSRFYGVTDITGMSGLGSQVVADIYISWGIVGVMLLFFLFGKIVGKCYLNRDRLYSFVLYISLVSWSIYIPRESMFDPYRDMIWMVLLTYLLINIKSN